MASDPKCTECSHPRTEHEIEPPYRCYHVEYVEMCDCKGFSYALRDAAPVAETPADQSFVRDQALLIINELWGKTLDHDKDGNLWQDAMKAEAIVVRHLNRFKEQVFVRAEAVIGAVIGTVVECTMCASASASGKPTSRRRGSDEVQKEASCD